MPTDIDQMRARLSAIESERRRIHQEAGEQALSADQQNRWGELDVEEAGLRAAVEEAERVNRAAANRSAFPTSQVGHWNGLAQHTGNATRDSAKRALDAGVRSRLLPEHAAERAELLLTGGRREDQALAAQWVAAAGSEHYARAFAKLAGDPQRGHLMWTEQEAAAFRAANELRTALNLSGAGPMVPTFLDPSIMLTNAGSNNPLRRISRVVTTVTSSWNGVTSAGASFEWKTEGSQAADGTPALGDVDIPVFLGDVNAIYSYEVDQDALSFLAELQRVMMDAADNGMAAAYTTGNGSSEPMGIVTALAAASPSVVVPGTGNEALDDSDPFGLQNVLPARFSANASWISHIAIRNAYAQMETTNGALLFPELRQSPPTLLGKPWYENSNMDGTINTSATADNYVLIYGDFQHFVIVDRIGATFEILPVFGADGRPKAQRQAFMTLRTGSDTVVDNAFRMLNVATSA